MLGEAGAAGSTLCQGIGTVAGWLAWPDNVSEITETAALHSTPLDGTLEQVELLADLAWLCFHSRS